MVQVSVTHRICIVLSHRCKDRVCNQSSLHPVPTTLLTSRCPSRPKASTVGLPMVRHSAPGARCPPSPSAHAPTISYAGNARASTPLIPTIPIPIPTMWLLLMAVSIRSHQVRCLIRCRHHLVHTRIDPTATHYFLHCPWSPQAGWLRCRRVMVDGPTLVQTRQQNCSAP